jgi:hypothetical protein
MVKKPIDEKIEHTDAYNYMHSRAQEQSEYAHGMSGRAHSSYQSGVKIPLSTHQNIAHEHAKAHDFHKAASHLAHEMGMHEYADEHKSAARAHADAAKLHKKGGFYTPPEKSTSEPEPTPDSKEHSFTSSTRSSAKKEFHQNAAKYHPDMGGSHEDWIKYQNAFKQHYSSLPEDAEEDIDSVMEYLRHLSYGRSNL